MVANYPVTFTDLMTIKKHERIIHIAPKTAPVSEFVYYWTIYSAWMSPTFDLL